MIQLKGIYRYYKGRAGRGPGSNNYALKDINITFQSNEITSILGNSGSGKTTLANIISGFERQDSGEVLYDGFQMRQRDTIRNVFQDPYISLNPVKNVKWHVQETARLNFVEQEEIWKNLEYTGITEREYGTRFVNTLSGGEMQRLSFSMAISQNPKYVVLDEPFSYLDTLTMFKLMQMAKDTRGKITYIYMDHDFNRCAFISDHIFVLNEGQIIENGTPEQLISQSKSEITRSIIENMPQMGKRI